MYHVFSKPMLCASPDKLSLVLNGADNQVWDKINMVVPHKIFHVVLTNHNYHLQINVLSQRTTEIFWNRGLPLLTFLRYFSVSVLSILRNAFCGAQERERHNNSSFMVQSPLPACLPRRQQREGETPFIRGSEDANELEGQNEIVQIFIADCLKRSNKP